jgi:hypothetical protein
MTAANAGCATCEPSLPDVQAAVLAVLDGAIAAAAGLPRISPASISGRSLAVPPLPAAGLLAGSSGTSSADAATIPAAGVHDSAVQAAVQV